MKREVATKVGKIFAEYVRKRANECAMAPRFVSREYP